MNLSNNNATDSGVNSATDVNPNDFNDTGTTETYVKHKLFELFNNDVDAMMLD